MAILAAPYLEEKLPAQQGNALRIPFTLNRAVGESDIDNIQLKIKTISTNVIKANIISQSFFKDKDNQYIAIFQIDGNDFQIGQFYKAQIAFIDKSENADVGDFSTVGIFKYTKVNSIKILDAQTKEELQQFKYNSQSYIGEVVIDDITEKIAEYKFSILDENDNLFYSTDYLLHDPNNNKENQISIDFFQITKDLSSGKSYSIIYTVKTINGLELSSIKYYFIVSQEISVPFPGKLKIKVNNEDGYFSLFVLFTESKNYSGSFKILRADSETNYTEWNEMYRLAFSNKSISAGETLELFKDFTVKQGVTYKYAIQQYSGTFYARKIICDTEWLDGKDRVIDGIQVNFEDILLYDGNRQLKIKYNPKIASFKNTILENKIDTIGSKYPFFFKNGIVDYKEFPISGLISYFMDDNNNFISNKREATTNLTYSNIQTERDFKLEVLKWLSNGELKLFRSPTEGNYIVRLMNVSLTPIDTLGRMLHSFSATAYECAEYTFKNLEKYKFTNNNTRYFQDTRYDILYLKNIKAPIKNQKIIPYPIKVPLPNAIYARLVDLNPGTELLLHFTKNSSSIVIGYTGQYNINIEHDNPLIGITIPIEEKNNGFIEYAYNEIESSKFIYDREGNKIGRFEVNSFIEQYCGDCAVYDNLIDNNSETIESIPLLRIQEKLIEEVWEHKGNLYMDSLCNQKVPLLSTSLYYSLNTKQWYCYNGILKKIDNPDYSYSIKYKNNKKSNFILNSGKIEINLQNTTNIENIYLGNALYVDIYYNKSSYERE